MIRTFHSKLNRKTLFFCLLPATVLAVYFFWERVPLPALCCMVFMVFVVERLIHTSYVFTDDGFLHIHQGRFAKVEKIALSDILTAETVSRPVLSFLHNRDTVVLTLRDGSVRMVTPSPAKEFCNHLRKRKEAQVEN